MIVQGNAEPLGSTHRASLQVRKVMTNLFSAFVIAATGKSMHAGWFCAGRLLVLVVACYNSVLSLLRFFLLWYSVENPISEEHTAV